jgi:hypothetical protein
VATFGADFLETWISPVDYHHGFVAARAYEEGVGRRGKLISVTPRESLTDLNADEWLPQVRAAKAGMGVDVNDASKLVDLKAAGVVDPARVTKEALLNAVSIAGTSMTMGALVAEVPEKESAGAGAGAPGMGGGMGMM